MVRILEFGNIRPTIQIDDIYLLEGYKETLSPDLRKIRAKEIWEKYCVPLSNYEINIEGNVYINSYILRNGLFREGPKF